MFEIQASRLFSVYVDPSVNPTLFPGNDPDRRLIITDTNTLVVAKGGEVLATFSAGYRQYTKVFET